MKKRSFSQYVGDFLDGKGFYLVLLLCLALIAGSGLYLWHTARSYSAETDELAETVGEALIEATPVETETEAETGSGSDAEFESDTGSEATDDPESALTGEDTEQATGSAEEVAGTAENVSSVIEDKPDIVISLQYPLEGGEIVAAFSAGKLTYNTAMGDWRTHDGIDIAAELGASVLAAADGTVTSVEEDPLLGVVITIDHGNGLVTSYGNLSAENLVAEAGDTVGAGQVLGQVGTTAAGESNDGGWLHFSVTQDGMTVDPEEFWNQS